MDGPFITDLDPDGVMYSDRHGKRKEAEKRAGTWIWSRGLASTVAGRNITKDGWVHSQPWQNKWSCCLGSEELAIRKNSSGGKRQGGQTRRGQTRTLEQGGRVGSLTPPTSAPTNSIGLFPEGKVCGESGMKGQTEVQQILYYSIYEKCLLQKTWNALQKLSYK